MLLIGCVCSLFWLIHCVCIIYIIIYACISCLVDEEMIPRCCQSDVQMCCDSLIITSLYCIGQKDGNGSIHIAAWCGRLNIVKYLINNAAVDKNVRGRVSWLLWNGCVLLSYPITKCYFNLSRYIESMDTSNVCCPGWYLLRYCEILMRDESGLGIPIYGLYWCVCLILLDVLRIICVVYISMRGLLE